MRPMSKAARGAGCEAQEFCGAAIGRQLERAEDQRRQWHEQQDELHERYGRARKVLNAVPARQDVAGPGDREGENGKDRGEDLQPSRSDREQQFVARAQP